MLQKLTNGAINKASQILSTIKKEILPDSQANPYLPEIENLLSKKTYLDTLQALEKLIAKKKWKRPKEIHQQVKWIASEDLFTIEEFVIFKKKDREEATRLEQSIRNRIQHELKQKEIAEQKRIEEQQVTLQKRAEERKLGEQRRIDDQNRNIAEKRRRAEEKANQVLADYFRELPGHLGITILLSIVGWLVIGSGSCMFRSVYFVTGPNDKLIRPEGYSIEGFYTILFICGISAIVLVIKFIIALIGYYSVKA